MSRIGPPAAPGQRVGLLGGSFDPAHAGHLLITDRALKALRLDAVWWMVSPGNPLKSDAPARIGRRVAEARRLVRDRRVTVTDLEARIEAALADTLSPAEKEELHRLLRRLMQAFPAKAHWAEAPISAEPNPETVAAR